MGAATCDHDSPSKHLPPACIYACCCARLSELHAAASLHSPLHGLKPAQPSHLLLERSDEVCIRVSNIGAGRYRQHGCWQLPRICCCAAADIGCCCSCCLTGACCRRCCASAGGCWEKSARLLLQRRGACSRPLLQLLEHRLKVLLSQILQAQSKQQNIQWLVKVAPKTAPCFDQLSTAG